jgi:hypothetical protein
MQYIYEFSALVICAVTSGSNLTGPRPAEPLGWNNVVFPSTDHAFDLALPQINPAAQSALYDVDRFLALLRNRGVIKK